MAYRTGVGELNDRIATARSAMARRAWLLDQREAVNSQLEWLRPREARLLRRLEAQKREVQRCEGLGMESLLSTIQGTKAERLEKERRWLQSAKRQHDEVVAEVARLRSAENAIINALAGLDSVEERMAEALGQKEQFMTELGVSEAASLLAAQQRLVALHAQIQKLDEAIDAGKGAIEALKAFKSAVDAADSVSIWGGLQSLIIYRKLGEAARLLPKAKWALVGLERKLQAVGVQDVITFNIDDFGSLADCFRIRPPWLLSVRSKIGNAQRRSGFAISRVKVMVDQLEAKRQQLVQERDQTHARRTEVLVTW